MRKIVLFIGVLLFMAVPVMAAPSNVHINCSDDDVNCVTVSYESDANLIRAFALDINTNDANITKVEVLDPNYRIYPGQIVIVDGNVTDYNTPYAPGDLGDDKVTVEMGSLYAADDPDFNHPPDANGDLLKFYVDGSCNYKVDVNTLRGSVVMEDPDEEPNVTLCDGNIPGGPPPEFYDFGDAPDSYLTLLASNGPRHKMSGLETGIGPILGILIDAEANAQLPLDTTGDDLSNQDDEDDVAAFVAVKGSATGTVDVTVSQAAGYLNAFVDFNDNGVFDLPGEQIFTDQAVVVGPNPGLVFAISGNAIPNNPLVSRWRVTSYTLGAGQYFGLATDGEVEDHNVVVTCPPPADPPSGPTPNDGATCVVRTTDLSWTPGAGTVTQDIYFGTTNPPPLVASDVPVGTTTYDTGTMAIYTCYFWQIIEKNACGDVTTGTLWHFKTGPTNSAWPCCATCLGDASADGWVKTGDITTLGNLLRTAPLNRYQYTAPQYNACGDFNQDGWNKTSDITAIGNFFRPLPFNRYKCPTCP